LEGVRFRRRESIEAEYVIREGWGEDAAAGIFRK